MSVLDWDIPTQILILMETPKIDHKAFKYFAGKNKAARRQPYRVILCICKPLELGSLRLYYFKGNLTIIILKRLNCYIHTH
jgi:hypothetical protein